VLDTLGISFMPGAEGGPQQDLEPLQEAVKLLNLRLPSVVGASSPVSPQLLGATGLSGQTNAEFLRKLLGLDMPAPRPVPSNGSAPGGSASGGFPGPMPGGSVPPPPESPNGGFPGGNVMPAPQPRPRPMPPRMQERDDPNGRRDNPTRRPGAPPPRIIINDPRGPGY
jgi:hypothetical protein